MHTIYKIINNEKLSSRRIVLRVTNKSLFITLYRKLIHQKSKNITY